MGEVEGGTMEPCAFCEIVGVIPNAHLGFLAHLDEKVSAHIFAEKA